MKYCRQDNVVARCVAGENVLIPVHGCTRTVYTLNPTGCLLWDLLAGPCPADDLAAALAARYRLPPDRAAADVRAFLDDLLRMDLVRMVDDAPAGRAAPPP
jgi:hypothetical protein